MTILLISILMQISQPKLELPKIIVYGKRNVSLEIWKEDLIPDTVSRVEFPKPIQYNLGVAKFSYPWKYRERSFLLNGTVLLGSDFSRNPVGLLKFFYGKPNFYTIASYSYNRKIIEHGIAINTRIPYVRGDFVFKKYKENDSLNMEKRTYTRVSLTSNISKGPLFFEGSLLLGSLAGENKEVALFLKSTLLKKFKHYPMISNIYLSWDKVWLLCLTERVSKKWKDMSFEPGININYPKPYFNPYFKFKISNFFLEYSPRVALRTRDESLNDNPFIKDVLKGDTIKLAQHRTYITMGANFKNMNIEGGWIENYPSFDTSNGGNYYILASTEIVWFSTSIYWNGLKAKVTYSHSYKLAPHIPLASVSVEYEWRNFTVVPSYKNVKDCKGKTKHLLSCSLSWHSPYQFIYSISKSTFFIELDNLFKGYEIWKGYDEKPKFYIGTKFKL